ncbi:MAG TPA: PAS domain S-box protein [Polyangiaceae bacterium]|nr:PAS domain S-box protein [Polyangiaceae bacterium]
MPASRPLRSKAQNAFLQSEARYRALIQSQIDLVSRYRPDTILTFVNDAYCQFFGKSREDLVGQSFMFMVAPEYRPLVQRETEELAKHPRQLVGEYVNYTHAGEMRWIQWIVHCIPDESGRTVELQAVGRDVTRLKHAEDALRQAMLVVENSPAVLFRWKAVDGWPVDYVSENVTQLGYTRSELLSGTVPYMNLVHPDDAARVSEELSHFIAHGIDHFQQEYQLLARDGTIRWVDARTAVERDNAGAVTHIQGIVIDITERKRAVDALQDSQAFLETIFEHSPYAMGVTDARGTLIRVNQACRDLLGVREGLWIDRLNIRENKSIEPEAKALAERALAGERVQFPLAFDPSRCQTEGTQTSKQLLLDVTMSPVLGSDLRVAHAIVQVQDITERTRAEAALRRVNRQLRMISDCNQALIRATDESELLSSVCDLVVQVGGYRMAWVGYVQENEARTVLPIACAGYDEGYVHGVNVTWSDNEHGRGPIGMAIRTGQPCWLENIATEPSFAPWLAEATKRGYAAVCGLPLIAGDHVLGALAVYAATPRAFDAEEISHLSELASDVAFGVMGLRARAERTRAEDMLRAREERFRQLVLNSNDVIALTDASGLLFYLGGAVERIFGYNPEELIGQPAGEHVHPEDRDRLRVQFYELVHKPTVSSFIEFRIQRKNGEWAWVESIGTNLLEHALVRGIVINIRDITERKNAEEERKALQNQLQQAMKMEAVGRVAGGVAHDFNNLLTAIGGNAEMAKLELTPDAPAIQYLEQVERAARSAASLTRHLLAFSRRQIIEPQNLNLNELIDELRKMLVRVIGEDVTLDIALTADLGTVRVDPGQFEQVLVNLAVNARDAMPNGGKLLIATARTEIDATYCARHPNVTPGTFVVLSVSDTGHGMTEEVKQHLFEPFFTTKAKGHGTGLGLATTFGIVKQAGGAVEVYSEVGIGTTVKIYLPEVAEPATRVVKAIPVAVPVQGTETILLVEDDNAVRELAALFLRRQGYHVLVASNGFEALILCERDGVTVDLLLTDVVMPGMNGRDLAERMLSLHPDMRVLFSSGYAENVISHHGVIDEQVNFIGKPYAVQALAKKVRTVLDQPRARLGSRHSTGLPRGGRQSG